MVHMLYVIFLLGQGLLHVHPHGSSLKLWKLFQIETGIDGEKITQIM